MSFLKTLFWVIFLVGFTVFAVNNWQPISVKLWGGLWLDTKLPALLALSFIIGFLPLYIWHKSQGYRLKRRIASLEGARPMSSFDSSPNVAPQPGAPA
jgi:lipopolysaccharide assembly protein A